MVQRAVSKVFFCGSCAFEFKANYLADGDTLFFFNYRSDRMREIATVFGQLDDVVDIQIPKDLVGYFCEHLRL